MQQNNILTDIQQHQNRFNNQQHFRAIRQQQPPFITQNQPFSFPQPVPRFTQQLPNQQSAPAFRPNPQAQRQVKQKMSPYARYPLINRFMKFFRQIPPNAQQLQAQPPRQSQFQRSVHNQVGQVSFTQPQPPQFNQFGQQTFPNNPFVFQEPLNSFNKAPVAAPLVQPQQQLPLRQAPQNFLPNSPQQSPPVVFPNNQQQLPHHQQLNSFLPPVNFVPKNSFVAEPSRLIQSPQFGSLPVAFPQQQPQQSQQQPQQPQPQPPQLQPIVQPFNPFVQPSQSLPLEHKGQLFHDTRTEEQRQRDDQYRLKLIEKQEKYVQKYYQKQLQQAQSLHQDFAKQQALIQEKTREKLRPQQSAIVQTNVPRHQGVPPSDLSAFEKSVNNFYHENPTTLAATTTTTSTVSPLTVVPLSKKTKSKPDVNVVRGEDIQALLQGALNKPSKKKKVESAASSSPLTQEELLEHIKKLSLDTQGLGDKNFTTQDLTLADGQKVQIIRTSDPELIRKAKAGNAQIIEQPSGVIPTTQAPVSIEDLAKSGILPPGLENFEVIKPGENGLQQRVKKIPQMKKVTFVYLEEQEDGSLKVQGVRGGNDKEVKKSGSEVDSILDRIKKGEIQLPAGVKDEKRPIEIPTPAPTASTRQQPSRTSAATTAATSSSVHPKNHRNIATVNSIARKSTTAQPQTVTPNRPSFKFSFTATTAKTTVDNGRSPYSTLPTFGSSNSVFSVTPRVARLSTTTEVPEYQTASSVNRIQGVESQKYVGTTRQQSQSPAPSTISNVFASSAPISQAQQNSDDMIKILKNAGLFAMAKYLRQSGLDSILNETGPYTIFAPTDKAFKSLLVQLGGPEKAEEKFKNNPRLLSGLLLHHVIPGSFKIDELQDEMTGVSLAGTQLRVNQYQMQDLEWNDVKVTTVNGATIYTNNSDLVIPQGVAHGVDRVMFPLPVGDILQTLQSDRERRFTNFLRAVFASNMADTLQNKGERFEKVWHFRSHPFRANDSIFTGIKTYTIFAPTDLAFSHLSHEELNTLVSDKDTAQELVKRHILPNTMFTSGMRFYQTKDTLADEKAVTIQKVGGEIGQMWNR